METIIPLRHRRAYQAYVKWKSVSYGDKRHRNIVVPAVVIGILDKLIAACLMRVVKADVEYVHIIAIA